MLPCSVPRGMTAGWASRWDRPSGIEETGLGLEAANWSLAAL